MMKYTIAFVLIASASTALTAQTMKWIAMDAQMAKGSCTVASELKYPELCYALEYTPAVSGTLTSYTTGFLVTCTSRGPAVIRNQSCAMKNNVRLLNGCSEYGKVLMNSSGNSGTSNTSKVEAGVPVILHQVCFSLPYGEEVTVTKDPATSLTTSLDATDGVFTTEYPEYDDITIRHKRIEAAPSVWIDFAGIAVGDLTSQLDWSATEETMPSYFVVERSLDGMHFHTIGRVDAVRTGSPRNYYQFLDKNASRGINHYRLMQVKDDGRNDYSPVRQVNFDAIPFAMSFTPNPADDHILVNVSGHTGPVEIRILDISGKVMLFQKQDQHTEQVRMNIENISPGVYSLAVESGQDKLTERFVITH